MTRPDAVPVHAPSGDLPDPASVVSMVGVSPGAHVGGLEVTGVAAGGDGIARQEDGRIVFVEGGLPGELVDVEIVESRKDFAKGVATLVRRAAPERVEPPCEARIRGCGGCGWQHVTPTAQARLKREIIIDSLRRLARMPEPPVLDEVRSVEAHAYRTTLRLAVDPDTGRAGHRRHHARDVVLPEEGCLVAHPLLDELVRVGSYRGVDEVVLRVSAATGERLAVLHRATGSPGGSPGDEDGDAYSTGADLPEDVQVVDGSMHGARAQRRARQAAITEEVLGRRYRVSPSSFFQSGPAAAALLAEVVTEAVAPFLPEDGSGMLLDAYCGVGLLAGAVTATRTAWVVGVEEHGPAASDARYNLDALGVEGEILGLAVARIPAPRSGENGPDVIVADPARPGLGKGAAAALARLGSPRIVLVSCDPASLARDAALLAARGYRLEQVQVLDLFPHTAHMEAIATFTAR